MNLNNKSAPQIQSQSYRLSLERVITLLRELTEARNALEALRVGGHEVETYEELTIGEC
jgi:hypothetical protein